MIGPLTYIAATYDIAEFERNAARVRVTREAAASRRHRLVRRTPVTRSNEIDSARATVAGRASGGDLAA